MDAHYGANGWIGDLRLQQSLFIASTIMSTAKPGRAVCDVGLKGVAVDSGLPRIKPGELADRLRYIAANDEHGILQAVKDEEAKVLDELLGQHLLLIPGHCDPTCNLYADYVGVRKGMVECVWSIDARGLSQ
jgi:D-serine deaminase-like pyridoxal phosphate-dependent protein